MSYCKSKAEVVIVGPYGHQFFLCSECKDHVIGHFAGYIMERPLPPCECEHILLHVEDRIKELEKDGDLDPNCNGCKEFYEAIRNGKRYNDVFAPRHKAMESCKSGKYPHCTCDTCF